MATETLEFQGLDMEPAEFGAKVRILREAVGWTQLELADRLGVAQRTISHIEQGRNLPSIETAFAMADIFGIDINEFRKLPKAKHRGRGRPRKDDE